tara:strand:- start:1344 stop:1547 length:204 start_codon:yes stop_codon:yes gene_type:complete
MIFEENKIIAKWGEITGYIFSYFLFTTILFFILILLKKIPESWSYLSIMIITALIALLGTGMRRFLK